MFATEETPVHVASIWRYPVKSLRGESLSEAEIGWDGIAGDRLVRVETAGRITSARTRPALLGLAGTLGEGGEPLIDGIAWSDPRSLTAIRAAAGPHAELRRSDGSGSFDVLPLLVTTDGAIAAFGRDGRRLRPNIVIGGVDGLEERAWPGSTIVIGDVRIDVSNLRARCVMTTVDPDSLEQDHGVLRDIVRRFDATLALDCAVGAPGRIRLGDAVALVGGRHGSGMRATL